MKVLLISSSARGHAIADALARSPRKPQITSICPNRNPGLRALAEEQFVMDIMDFEKILEIGRAVKPDFAIVGPDDPIAAGLADRLEGIEIPTVAPRQALARIESSKSFARELLHESDMDVSPKFRVFSVDPKDHGALKKAKKEMYTFIDQELEGNYVVKFDALKGGKGVKVQGEHLLTIEDGIAYALECLKECGRVVIEEKLIGVEFSLLSFVSGKTVLHMPIVQDHKRAYDADEGPNTGGMGTYTDRNHSLPFLEESDVSMSEEINRRVASTLMEECGMPFKGILYGGFMAVRDGVRVIEFNARFGDPEALNILPLLESDFVGLCEGILSGELEQGLVHFAKKATVCKYITPLSYPEAKDQKGQEVRFPSDIPANARIYYGDVSEDHEGTLRLGGSRSAGIVGIGRTIAEAEAVSEELCEKVEGPVRFRSDIGKTHLIEKRIETMRGLRA